MHTDRILCLMAAMMLTCALASSSAHASDAPFPPADAPKIETGDASQREVAVKAIFQKHCVQCHQSDQTPNGRAIDAFGNILNLFSIERDPGLVRPHMPDVSPIYEILASRHAPLTIWTDREGPTQDDAETVRNWIENLPTDDAVCTTPGSGDEPNLDHLVRSWQATFPDRKTGFISLQGLVRRCVLPQTIKQARETLSRTLSGIVRERLQLETLGSQSTLLTVPLDQSPKLTPRIWERLKDAAPVLQSGALPGAWLAAHLAARPRTRDGSIDADLDPALPPADRNKLLTLARLWRAPVDLGQAAIEQRVTRDVLWEKLKAVADDTFKFRARKLMQGTLSRTDWLELQAHLAGRTTAAPDQPGERKRASPNGSEPDLEIALWTEKRAYAPGDLLQLSVMATKACHLNIVSIEPDGQARIIFPSDIEPDNLIAPRLAVRIPGARVPYQIRLADRGRETLLAFCKRHRRTLPGVRLNYERQRFPILGDWRGFLRVIESQEQKLEKERARKAQQKKRRRWYRRRRTRDTSRETMPAIDPKGPDTVARAAVSILVE